MVRLSILRHKKRFSDVYDVIELSFDGSQYIVRSKYGNMKKSSFLRFKDSFSARNYYNNICLFTLS